MLCCELSVSLPKIESSKDQLIVSLFKLSIGKVIDSTCITSINEIITDGRKTRYIDNNLISVVWASASSIAERDLQAIKIPIFKGLLGYRIFVINERDQPIFDQVETLQDLQKFTAGQGLFWGDTKVLRAAGINVITSSQGRRLWQMLNLKRFDFMPLAVHEPWKDLSQRQELELAVEKNLMLVYPSAFYFYVSHKNKALYEALIEGMTLALKDGSYDELLYHSDMIQSVIKYANFEKRKIIRVENPYFSPGLQALTPKDELVATTDLIDFLTKKPENR